MRKKLIIFRLFKPSNSFFKCNASLHELSPPNFSSLKQSKFFLMKQSLDLNKEKEFKLDTFENCFSPERKSMENKNTSTSPLFTKKKSEIFNLGNISVKQKTSFEEEFEDFSVSSMRCFSKFDNDYDVLGVEK